MSPEPALDSVFDGWAIVELMGHRRLAGHLTEVQIAGTGFLRLDVYDASGAAITQFYPPAAIYCITPTTEELARKLGDKARPQPVTRYELEPIRAGEFEPAWEDS